MLNLLQGLTYGNPYEKRVDGQSKYSIMQLGDLLRNQMKNSSEVTVPSGDNSFKNFYNLAPMIIVNNVSVDDTMSNTQRGPPPAGGPSNSNATPPPPPPPPPPSFLPAATPNSRPLDTGVNPDASLQERFTNELKAVVQPGVQDRLKKTSHLMNAHRPSTTNKFQDDIANAATVVNAGKGIDKGTNYIEAHVSPSMMATLILTNYNALMNSFAYYNTKENNGSILSIQLGGNLLVNTLHRVHSIRIKKSELQNVYDAIKIAALTIGSDMAMHIASRTFVVETNRPDQINKLVLNLLGKVKEDIALTKGGKLLIKRLYLIKRF
jgi:hypothetical protein